MSLKQTIETEYKNALKSKEKTKISTYRLILSSIKDLDIVNRSGPDKKETDDEEIFTGESLISSAYNRVAEPYANFVNEQDTRNRILLLVIQDIKRQLALFKKNQGK